MKFLRYWLYQLNESLHHQSHQQLDRCVAATVRAARHHSNSPAPFTFTPGCVKTTPVHQSLKSPTETDTQEHVYQKPVRYPWAEMASDWNMVSNQQRFTDQSIDQWRDCFIACLKAKSKHFEHLLWCVSLWYVTVMTFKAYTTAVMNKLTHVSFHKVGWEQPSGEVVNFVAVSLQIY